MGNVARAHEAAAGKFIFQRLALRMVLLVLESRWKYKNVKSQHNAE